MTSGLSRSDIVPDSEKGKCSKLQKWFGVSSLDT